LNVAAAASSIAVTPAIFISYRRHDTASAAGRLADALAKRFGIADVFRDIQTIEPGDDFRSTLQNALRSARVVLVIVGPSWSGAADPRLDDPHDYVRIELESALAEHLLIIPVLVEGAQMPVPAVLPESIRPFAYRQAHEISDSRWSYDTDRLVDLLARHGLEPRAPEGPARLPLDGVGRQVLTALAQVPGDFLRLLYEPRRFLTERGAGTPDDLRRAAVFLLVSQCMGGLLDVQEWPTRSGVLSFVLTAPVLVLLVVLVTSFPMYLAWRMAGARREYQPVVVILAYQCSFAGMALSLATFVMLLGIELTVSTALHDLAGTLTLEQVGRLLTSLQAAPSKGPWLVAALIMYSIAIGTIIWLAVSWRSYGDALGPTGLKSVAALTLFALFVGIPIGVMVWAATLGS
jgi:hypothetical protein